MAEFCLSEITGDDEGTITKEEYLRLSARWPIQPPPPPETARCRNCGRRIFKPPWSTRQANFCGRHCRLQWHRTRDELP